MPNIMINGFEMEYGWYLSDLISEAVYNLGFVSNEAIVTVAETVVPISKNCVLLHGFDPKIKSEKGFRHLSTIAGAPVIAVDSFTRTLHKQQAPYVSIHTKTMTENQMLLRHLHQNWGSVDVEKHLIPADAKPCLDPHLRIATTMICVAQEVAAIIRPMVPRLPIYQDIIGFESCRMS